MPFEYTQIMLNVALGLAVGTYGTLVGAGGGFVLVPLFLLVYGLPHEVAVGTSLAVVVANAVSGALSYVVQKKVDYRAGITFGLATLPGAYFGAGLTHAFSGPAFTRTFGAFLIVLALYLLFRRAPKSFPRERHGWGWVTRAAHTPEGDVRYSYHEPAGMVLSTGVGALSSWLGIGGGVVHVPVMTELLRFPVAMAVATSHFVLAFTALAGAAVHAREGDVNWALALPIGAGAVVGAQIGAQLARKAKGSWVLKALSVALVLVGLRLVTA